MNSVLPSKVFDDETDGELWVAFDFDGVIADDESEAVFQKNRDLSEFHAHEVEKQSVALLAGLFRELSHLQQLEAQQSQKDPSYRKILRISIVIARCVPAHERVVTTLKAWGVSVDEAFFLGGMEKSRILSVLQPHIFFDDQRPHLQSAARDVPMVHVPFGITNKSVPEAD